MLRSGGAPLLGLFALAALALFAALAGEVRESETWGWDTSILLALRTQAPGTPVGPAWLLPAALEITGLGGSAVVALLSLGAVGLLLTLRRFWEAAFVALALGGGNLVTALLKIGFARPRPEVVPYLTDFSSMSFPSGHATVSAITYLTLGALVAGGQKSRAAQRYIMACTLLVTLLIGLSRVYLGVHWPSDVLAGWCFGAAWAAICRMIASRHARAPAVLKDVKQIKQNDNGNGNSQEPQQ